MGTINRSKDSEFHTQRNNKKYPMEACNVTSYVMAGKQAGILFDTPDGVQPEDWLFTYMNTPEYYERMQREHPWSWERMPNGRVKYHYRPNEIHAMLAEAFNELVGRDVATFYEAGRPSGLIAAYVRAGCGVVLSGRFPYRGGTIGHIVSLAGYSFDGDEIIEWIIDDPFGDYHTDYTDHRGNNVPVDTDDFRQIFRPPGSDTKMCHVIRG
jgi:hypothetical protein